MLGAHVPKNKPMIITTMIFVAFLPFLMYLTSFRMCRLKDT